MLRARSILEAMQYAELQPCKACGSVGFVPAFEIEERDEALIATGRQYCPVCGARRQLELLLAEERVPPDAWGNTDASSIIDAGQWLALSDRLLTSNLQRARDAVVEVLKFIPADAQEPPRSAFFTADGRKMYSNDPSRFHRERLAIAQAAYEELLHRNGRLRR